LLCSGCNPCGMAKIRVDDTVRQQLLNMSNALVARAFELFEGQAGCLICSVNLLYAHARGPARFEIRQGACDLLEVDTIASLVGTSIARIFDPAFRYDICHDSRNLTDPVILFGSSDVESFVEDFLDRRRQHCNEGARDVLDMNDRPPRASVRFQVDEFLGHCPSNKIVEDDVEAHARREAIGRRGTQECWTKVIRGE